jgi:hypothetical protein
VAEELILEAQQALVVMVEEQTDYLQVLLLLRVMQEPQTQVAVAEEQAIHQAPFQVKLLVAQEVQAL